MPACCVCHWQNCSAYSAAFKEANHVLSGFYHVSCGARTAHVRKMIEQHLSVSDGVVNRMIVYTVAYHHWPEQLIIKNKNERRPLSKPICRSEAVQYGAQFVETSNSVDVIIHKAGQNNVLAVTDNGTKGYVQKPAVTQKVVSTLIASLTSKHGHRVISRSTPQESTTDPLIVESSPPTPPPPVEFIVEALLSLSSTIGQVIVEIPLTTSSINTEIANDLPSAAHPPTMDTDCITTTPNAKRTRSMC